MNGEELSLELLEDQVQSLAIAETPAEVFKALMEGARIAAPRTAIFLLKQSRMKGWGAIGYPADAATRQRQFTGRADEGWFAEILGAEQPLVSGDTAGAGYADFGQARAHECIGLAVRVKGRPIAVLIAERASGEFPWHPSVFGILVRVAQLRLDLDLVRRKIGAAASSPRKPPAQAVAPPLQAAAVAGSVASTAGVQSGPPLGEHSAASTATDDIPVVVSEPPAEAVSETAATAPAHVEQPSTSDADPRFQAARRYARLVATDIRLYNEEAVLEGRQDGDLFDRLRESLMRGRETFLRRHGDLGADGLRILHEAYVDVLAGGRAELISATALA